MHWTPKPTTVATDFSRIREHEPSNSGTFVTLNMLDYKRVEQSDHGREVVETAFS